MIYYAILSCDNTQEPYLEATVYYSRTPVLDISELALQRIAVTFPIPI